LVNRNRVVDVFVYVVKKKIFTKRSFIITIVDMLIRNSYREYQYNLDKKQRKNYFNFDTRFYHFTSLVSLVSISDKDIIFSNENACGYMKIIKFDY